MTVFSTFSESPTMNRLERSFDGGVVYIFTVNGHYCVEVFMEKVEIEEERGVKEKI